MFINSKLSFSHTSLFVNQFDDSVNVFFIHSITFFMNIFLCKCEWLWVNYWLIELHALEALYSRNCYARLCPYVPHFKQVTSYNNVICNQRVIESIICPHKESLKSSRSQLRYLQGVYRIVPHYFHIWYDKITSWIPWETHFR